MIFLYKCAGIKEYAVFNLSSEKPLPKIPVGVDSTIEEIADLKDEKWCVTIEKEREDERQEAVKRKQEIQSNPTSERKPRRT